MTFTHSGYCREITSAARIFYGKSRPLTTRPVSKKLPGMMSASAEIRCV
jgi:hypothetical protein